MNADDTHGDVPILDGRGWPLPPLGCERCVEPLAGNTLRCDRCDRYSANAVGELLGYCDREPRNGLAFVETLDEETRDVVGVAFAHFRAFQRMSLEHLANGGPDLHVRTASAAELGQWIDEEHYGFAESAVRLIPGFYRDELEQPVDPGDKLMRGALDEMCQLVNKIRPGRVQELLGWTRLKYFDQRSVKFLPMADKLFSDRGNQAFAAKMMDRRIQPPFTARSCVMILVGAHEDWGELIFRLLESHFDSQNPDEGKTVSLTLTAAGGEDYEEVPDEPAEEGRSMSALSPGLSEPLTKSSPPGAGLAARSSHFEGVSIGKRPILIASGVGCVLLVASVLVWWGVRKPATRPMPAGTVAFATPIAGTVAAGLGAPAVHVRSGPGIRFPVLDVLQAGSGFIEVGRASDAEGMPWIAIRRSDGTYGFIKERLIRPITAPAAPAVAIPTSDESAAAAQSDANDAMAAKAATDSSEAARGASRETQSPALGSAAASSPTRIERPELVSAPDNLQMAVYYPVGARAAGIGGQVRMWCSVTVAGRLTGCRIVSEDPPNEGFGASALEMSKFFRLTPMRRNGVPVSGGTIGIPITFQTRP